MYYCFFFPYLKRRMKTRNQRRFRINSLTILQVFIGNQSTTDDRFAFRCCTSWKFGKSDMCVLAWELFIERGLTLVLLLFCKLIMLDNLISQFIYSIESFPPSFFFFLPLMPSTERQFGKPVRVQSFDRSWSIPMELDKPSKPYRMVTQHHYNKLHLFHTIMTI